MNGYEEMNGFCGSCGAKRETSARFCSQCGAAFEVYETYDDGNRFDGERAKDAFEKGFGSLLYFLEQKDYIPYEQEENRFIHTNVEYYRRKFDEMRMLNQKVSLNWSALFFGIFWMLYRKMYGVAIAAVAATVVAGLLGTLGGVLGLALTLCYGLFGNYLYMMTVQKRVTDAQKFGEPARSQYVEKYAGTSNTAVIIGLVVVGLGSIPFWLMMGMSFLGMLAAML
ncbi:MAG: zinc ribbon domain-containing protein [Oscillospiraceae bacterium]|nr:zinc ribbon domain-containing protein [Oscillospiraceae bacterium]